MLDQSVQPFDDANKRSKQSLRPYQSVWLAHWKRTRCDAAQEPCNPDASGEKEVYEVTENDDLTNGVDDSTRSIEEFGIIKPTAVEIGGEIVNISSKSIGNERDLSDFTGVQFPSLVNKGKAVENSVNACLRESSTCDHYLSMFHRNMLPKMQKHSDIPLFPGQPISSKEFGTEKSLNDCYTLLKLQSCAHGVEKMGMCTRFVSKSGNVSGEFHGESPFVGRGKQQLTLQPVNSLIDNQLKENIRDVKTSNVTIRNASSSEIANMNLGSFTNNSKKNLHSGLNSTPSTLPALSGAASLSENKNQNSSKTQSLVMNKQSKAKSKFDLNDFPDAEPGNKWVKRLKLTSSHSSQGTNSSNFTSTSSHQNTSNLFSFGHTLEKQRGKKPVLPDNTWNFSKKVEDLLMENPKDKCKALLFSDSWIQRWLHNGQCITEAKAETNVVYELQSSKITMEKLQKEHLPSIAAMALMAKVLTCFQPCELQKRGPFTIWNTKTF